MTKSNGLTGRTIALLLLASSCTTPKQQPEPPTETRWLWIYSQNAQREIEDGIH